MLAARMSNMPNLTICGTRLTFRTTSSSAISGRFRNTGQVFGQAGTQGADIKASLAWDVAEGNKGIVVGMVDSGVDYTHPDLADNMWSAPSSFSVTISGQTITCAAGTHGFNAINRTCDPNDDDGHGTHTAGVVGAKGNSGLGISGISRVANMMALKFLDNTGQGTTANAIAAIEFAIQVKKKFPSAANVRVLNASWGGGTFSQALLDEINLAGANDMLFVAAAGNLGENNDSSPHYPAAYNAANLIAVAATDNRDQLAFFSNFGPQTVHLGAPGVDIYSTSQGNSYNRASGTSESAPMVSGAAALVLSACALNTGSLKSNILGSVDLIPSMSGITATGGRLNVNKAIRNCAGDLPANFTLGVSPAAQTIAFGTGNQFSVAVTALNGFTSTVSLSALNLPTGMTVTFSPAELTNGTSVLSVTAAPQVVQGTYALSIVATGGGVTRTAGILVTVGLPSSCTIDLSNGRITGMLVATDGASVHRPPAFADFCTFTLDGDRAINIEMSAGFNSPFIYLLSSSGQVLATGTSAGSSAKIDAELSAGTYTIEATSSSPGLVGIYNLYLRNTAPTLTSISPASGMAGTTVDVTFKGTAFVGAPFLVKISSCVGVTVSNITAVSSTTITARLGLPGTVATCAIGVSTAGGTSSTESFRIFPPPPVITGVSPNLGIQGQIMSVTLTGTNFVSPLTVSLLDPSPLNTGINLSATAITATTVTVTWTISFNALPGQHRFRVNTEGGTSNEGIFTIQASPPTLASLSPSGMGRGMSRGFSINGTGFSPPVQIDAGPDITVSDVIVTSFSTMSATFTTAADAELGDRSVTVTTTLGTSNAETFRVAPPPVITSFTPTRAFLGKEFQPPRETRIALTGTDLICGLMVVVEGGGGVEGSGACNDQNPSFSLFVTNTAPVGPRKVTVSGPNGTANPIFIDIVPVPPIIGSVTPPYGIPGATNVITLQATQVSGGTVSVSGGGITSTTLSSSGSSLTASLDIPLETPPGVRELTVTTSQGTSDPVPFTITPPTWPDLTINISPPPVLGAGYEETYPITIRNVGTKETTTPITVTFKLHSTEKFVSISGGWTCTVSNILTCVTANSIAAGSETTFQLVTTAPIGTSGKTFDPTVTSIEDYNTSNNSTFKSSQIMTAPEPNLKLSSQSLQPGGQGTVSLFLNRSFPHDIVDTENTLELTFVPAVSGTPMDPAAQFSSGGQKVSYIFRANTLTAEFLGVSGQLGFQTGTVAGTLLVNTNFKPKGGKLISKAFGVSVAAHAPTITAITTTKLSSGFESAITMYASTKDVTSISFRFNTATPIQLGCGGLSACTASGSIITFTVSSLFNTWYAGNTAFGSVATIRVPFNIQGTLSGSVDVTLTNALGPSNSMSFKIP